MEGKSHAYVDLVAGPGFHFQVGVAKTTALVSTLYLAQAGLTQGVLASAAQCLDSRHAPPHPTGVCILLEPSVW